MVTVVISADFRVVIPRAIREALELRPGQRLQAIVYGDRIELMPFRSLRNMRGFLAGLDSEVEREPDRM
jgi:AbrB family looped-hinge helix DNA binding protein